MYELLGAIAGLVILLIAGDALVRGAVNLSLRVGVPALIVSLTIVAFGTSAPELLIAVQSILEGVPGLAIGNVVGSNIANVLLVLGVPALLAGLHGGGEARGSFWQMIAATAVFIALCFLGPITWMHALVLLAALVFILGSQARNALAGRKTDEEDLEGADPSLPGWRIAFFLFIGIVGLPLGADLLVDNATIIAQRFGVSDIMIGLTLVAIGTSLPELATTVMAAYRRESSVAIGNVIGSNIFNLLGIIGVAALFGPIPVPESFLRIDLWVMFAASLLLFFVSCRHGRMGKRWGAALCGLYLAYMGYLFLYGASV